MKKKIKIILVLVAIALIVGGIIFFCFKKQSEENIQIEEYSKNINEFINCIVHRGGYGNGYYSKIYVFLDNGEYYYFNPQYDAVISKKAYKGTWTIEDNRIRANIEKVVYLDGGEIIDASEEENYINNKKRVNAELKVEDFLTTMFIEFENKEANDESKYERYLEIKDDASYCPIYKYNTTDEVKEKLKEMYGEVFTLLEE